MNLCESQEPVLRPDLLKIEMILACSDSVGTRFVHQPSKALLSFVKLCCQCRLMLDTSRLIYERY